ncbi:MAG: MBL fold metallo-hydrolase [Clostridia bacterium]|nr:MBL fold metallo-hydrolase [Clostridia bacterium]
MFLSLVSGSSGNCTLVSDGNTTILADCGLSCKKLEQALEKVKINPHDIDALVITHEHSDHIKGAGIVSRKYGLPVFATAKTHEVMDIGNIVDKNIKYITPDIDFEIGTIGVCPFSIPHDAANPVGYNFFFGEKKLSLATDIGRMNDYIMEKLKGSIAVLLESNHDITMLKNGRYPAVLKKRILSEFGHLSNDDAAKTVVELAKSGTAHIMLGHLSNENNTPTAAYTKTAQLLCENGLELNKDVALSVAARFEVSCFK